MCKPKSKTKTKKGSQTDLVLRYILGNENLSVKNHKELTKLIYQEHGLKINAKVTSKAILRYNEGLYIVDGEDVDRTGKIDIFKKSIKTKKDKTLIDTSNNSYVDIEELQSQVNGGAFKAGWFKTPSGDSIYISADKKDENTIQEELIEFEKSVKKQLTEEFWSKEKFKAKPVTSDGRTGVVFISDLHIGAFVKDMIKTPDFNTDIIKEKLLSASSIVNQFDFENIHVVFCGDLVQSFTGTNHKNTWKELEIDHHGPNVVRIAVNVIHEFFLSEINNLSKISMVAGNHCRMSQQAGEETQGGVSNLVAFCLELIGYDVDFDRKCISKDIDGIQYIVLHGDKGISKRSTKDIIWDFGTQGKFNFVVEGHLHSRIQKLTPKSQDSFRLVTDDSDDCRRQVLPSVFTGDNYSEDNLWFSNSGFIITVNNGKGKPIVFDIPL